MTVSKSERGIVYVSWGESCCREAVQSAKSVKAQHDYPTTLITDETSAKTVPSDFDTVMVSELRHSYRDKLLMQHAAYEKSLFLDSDTQLAGSIDPLFDLLNAFDLFVMMPTGGYHYEPEGIPASFPEPNAGVIGWRKNERTDEFFALWEKYYDEWELQSGEGAWDQRSLRQAIWHSQVRFTTLSSEWNFMPGTSHSLLLPVAVLHGRNHEKDLKEANAKIVSRTWMPKYGCHPRYSRASLSELGAFAFRSIKVFFCECMSRTLSSLKLRKSPENKRPA